MLKTVTFIACAAMLAASAVVSCSASASSDAAKSAPADTVLAGDGFNADSAMMYARMQTDFGPRVPGTEAHRLCRDSLVSLLGSMADTVSLLNSTARAYDGKPVPVSNILARFNPDVAARVLLLAHYDTRPWADHDPDPANHRTPIDGANDGASGVAALLEIARNLALNPARVGVDILLTDAEDGGTPQWADDADGDTEHTWCLGARQFAASLPYTPANRPRYGILLDMVGGRDARFNREYFSHIRARAVTDKVWATAARMGLSQRFPQVPGGAITDDHLPLIDAGIPTVDIVENASPVTGSFPATWHTMADNYENLDPAAMRDAGRVVLQVIYDEKP